MWGSLSSAHCKNLAARVTRRGVAWPVCSISRQCDHLGIGRSGFGVRPNSMTGSSLRDLVGFMQRDMCRPLRVHETVHGPHMHSARGVVVTVPMDNAHNQYRQARLATPEEKGNGLVVAGTVRTVCDHLVATFASRGSPLAVAAGPTYSAFLPQQQGGEECGELRVLLRAGPLRFGAIIEVRPFSRYRVEVTVLNGRFGLAPQRGYSYDRIWDLTDEACAPLQLELSDTDQTGPSVHHPRSRSRRQRSRRVAIAKASVRGRGRVHPGHRP